MSDDQHTIEIKLHGNLLQINAALDGNDRRRFRLLAKRRHELNARLARVANSRTTAEV